MKATHRGHCQVCNRVQKLPDSKLAKHGYKVMDGWFNRVCPGAAHLPLEQDKTMVEWSIKWAQERIKESEEAIVRWSVPATEPEAWFHEYVRNAYFARYVWRRVPLHREVKAFDNHHSFNLDTFTDHEGKQQPLQRYSISGPTLLHIADQLNQKYIEHFLRKNIKDMSQYIKDQKHRVKVWHQQPLLALD